MKQVQKVWAELSAKAQEVETPQESTELSEEVKVELGYIDDVAKDAEKALSKYKDANEIVSAWQKVSRQITDMNADVKYVRKNRKAFIMGIEGAIQDLQSDVKLIANKLEEVGINPRNNKQYVIAANAIQELKSRLNKLERIDDIPSLK